MKPRISLGDTEGAKWHAAFAKLEQGQKVTLKGVQYEIFWKYQENPYWLQLKPKRGQSVYVREGDALIYELSGV